jgi:hypothetical protein
MSPIIRAFVLEGNLSAIEDTSTSRHKRFAIRLLERALGRLLDRAIDVLVFGVVVVALGAAATSILLWSESLADWMGETEETARWLLLSLVVVGAVTPIAGASAVRRVSTIRFREPANVEITCTPTVIDLSGIGPGSSTMTVRVTDSIGRPARNAPGRVLGL